MHLGVLHLEFHLPGCQSLKEKRGRLRGVRDRFGRESHIAICESGLQDSHDRAAWSYLAMASDPKVVQSTLTRIETFIVENVDARITATDSEYW